MAAVVRVANLIQKNKDRDEVNDYIESLSEEWRMFVDGELTRSNETNNKSLGGQQPRSSMGDDDDQDRDYEMSMEKIMAKFSNFNQSLSSRESNNDDYDDDDQDDEDKEKKDDEEDEDDKDVIMIDRDEEYQKETTEATHG